MKSIVSRRMAVVSTLSGILSIGYGARKAVASDANPERKMALMPTGSGNMPCGSCEAPAELLAETTICPATEPGERLSISGAIYHQDGITPARGFALFLFQTDATGHYNKEGDPNNPRLRGWVRTGENGKYLFHTIRPARYPQLTNPAHIHIHIYGPGSAERYLHEYWFACDSLIPAADIAEFAGSGEFSPIVNLSRGVDGGWRGVRNIKLSF